MSVINFDHIYQSSLALLAGWRTAPFSQEEIRVALERNRPVHREKSLSFFELEEVIDQLPAAKNENGKNPIASRRGRPPRNWNSILAAFDEFVQLHGNGHGSIRNFCRLVGISERSFREARKHV